MAQKKINYSFANDGLGDPLRQAFVKSDDNFDELYTNKVDKITGKSLTDVNFSAIDKAKLDSIDPSTRVQSDEAVNDPLNPAFIKNKKTLLSQFDNNLDFIEDVTTVGVFGRSAGAWSTIDLSSKENTANKQNSLAVDGTGVKFPTIDAVVVGLNLKQPLEDQRLSQSDSPNFAKLNVNNPVSVGEISINGSQAGAKKYLIRNSITGVSNSGFEIRDDAGSMSPLVIEPNGHVDVPTSLSIALPLFTNNGVDKLQVGGTISASPSTLSNQVVVKSQLDLKANLANPNFTGTLSAQAGNFSGTLQASSLSITGGTASQFLKANGTVDSNAYAPTVSPTLTGTPTAPTAPTGTNTTQIATTAFVANADSGNVKLTGTQIITGTKQFTSPEGGNGLFSLNNSTSNGIELSNTSTGVAIKSVSSSSGSNIVSNQTATGTGLNYVGQNNGTNTFTVDKFGKIVASKLSLSTTSGSQSVGNANMVAGTITITTTAATTNSVIMLTRNSVGITGFLTYTTANGSFTINSNVIGDAGVISYVIFN